MVSIYILPRYKRQGLGFQSLMNGRRKVKKKWKNKTFIDPYGKKHKLLKCYDVWIFRYIITLMFPPMGVFLAKGIHGWMYILACCFLTVLFYFPGLMYAFIIMNGSSINVCKALRV